MLFRENTKILKRTFTLYNTTPLYFSYYRKNGGQLENFC